MTTKKLERWLVSDFELKEDATQAGVITGYGAVFGNVDSYGDVIEKGAFAESLSEWQARGKWPKMLLQHGGFLGVNADDMVPVGQWTEMAENDRGLKVKGRLFALNTERGRYIHENLKAGELDGLSIGFNVRPNGARHGTKPGEPDRTLTNINLWEVSLVTFPANDQARIIAVKALTLKKLRELEDRLGDRGLSRRDRVIAAAVIRDLLQRDAEAPESVPRDEVTPEAAEILKALNGNTDRLWRDVFKPKR